jgi:GNAT superfamily N-acetyltransferase
MTVLPPRRSTEGSPEAETIRVRRATTDADLDAWLRVRRVVIPYESAGTVAELRERGRGRAERLLVLAELDGVLVGSGMVDCSDRAGLASVAPRVLPGARRRGVGTALLAELARHALTLGLPRAVADVDSREGWSIAFAHRFGFEEVDRQVEQVRVLAGEPNPSSLPEGVEVVTIAERPGLLREAYPLACQGYADLAAAQSVTVSLDDWLCDEATLPQGSFVAVAGGEIVGYAGLCRHDDAGVAENGLTVVRRDWRRRGLATALKLRGLAWAAEHGYREVVTWTQGGNEGMRAVNERLGYATRNVSLTMTAPLPLEV